jgi:hypothetical protein
LILVGKELYFTVDMKKKKTYLIFRINNPNTICGPTMESTGNIHHQLVNKLIIRFKRFSALMNITYAEEYNNKSREAMVMIMNYLLEKNNIIT